MSLFPIIKCKVPTKSPLSSLKSYKHLIDVHDLDVYANLPLEKRTRKVWYWLTPWYILPFALPMEKSMFGLGEDELDEEPKAKGWMACDKYLKKEFPIQRFIREGLWDAKFFWFLRGLKYRIEEFYRKWIYRTFVPLNVELRKTIPTREWQDSDTKITNFLYQIVIDYVDREDCFNTIGWDHNEESEEQKVVLKQIYAFAKTGRAELCTQVGDALMLCHNKKSSKLSYFERYKEHDESQNRLEDLDNRYLNWIVKNRNILWT